MIPSIQDEAYGPDERNIFDLYLAESNHPTPLIFFIHGGSFIEGDKDMVNEGIPLQKYLGSGISVASVHHRFVDSASYPAPMHDAARALQYIRQHSAKWNIDPHRIASWGESSGAGIALWLGFHRDLVDFQNEDPILRHSSRVSCVIASGAQSTYDFRLMQNVVPGLSLDLMGIFNMIFGLPEGFDWNSDTFSQEHEALIQDCGPVSLITKDSAPVIVRHESRDEKDGNVHHPNFGIHLEMEMQKVGVECIRRLDTDYQDDVEDWYQEVMQFLDRHLNHL